MQKAVNPFWTAAVFVLGVVFGHISGHVRHLIDDRRIEALAKSVELCDTWALTCEKQREDDREAYFREKDRACVR